MAHSGLMGKCVNTKSECLSMTGWAGILMYVGTDMIFRDYHEAVNVQTAKFHSKR